MKLNNCWTCGSDRRGFELECDNCAPISSAIDAASERLRKKGQKVGDEEDLYFLSRLFLECAHDGYFLEETQLDTFFFGSLIRGHHSCSLFRNSESSDGARSIDGELVALGNILHTSGPVYSERLCEKIANDVKLKSGTDNFDALFSRTVIATARALQVSGYKDACLDLLLRGARVIDRIDFFAFSVLRSMNGMSEAGFWGVVEPHWRNWAANWSLSAERKEIYRPIWILISSSIAFNPVFFYLCRNQAGWGSYARHFEFPLDNEIANARERVENQVLLMAIDLDSLKRSLTYYDELHWLGKRIQLGRQYQEKLYSAHERMKALQERRKRVADLAEVDEFIDLIEGEWLAEQMRLRMVDERRKVKEDLIGNEG